MKTTHLENNVEVKDKQIDDSTLMLRFPPFFSIENLVVTGFLNNYHETETQRKRKQLSEGYNSSSSCLSGNSYKPDRIGSQKLRD